jgi:hypothetical protein
MHGMRRRVRHLLVPALSVLSLTTALRADIVPTSRAMTADTIVEIFIDDGSIRVELEIGLASLAAFRNIMPDELHERLGFEPEPFPARAERFFASDWVIRVDDGAPLRPRVEAIEGRSRVRRDEVTGEPLAMAEDELAVFVTLAYALDDRPATISFRPPGVDDEPGANIGFVAYHRGLAVNDFRYLAWKVTLILDWDDPWYSAFQNRNLRRYFNAPLNAFLYVEPLEVRKEVVARPLDLQAWVDLGLEGKDVIPAADRAAIEQRVASFLIDRCPVIIDGERVEPILDRVHFIRRSLRTTTVVEPGEDIPLVSAMLGVIYTYPIAGLPQEVTMEWSLFNDRVREVATVATDEAGGLPWIVTPDDPILTWKNFLKNPSSRALVRLDPPPEPARLSVPVLSAVCLLFAGISFARLRYGRPSARRGLAVMGAAGLVAAAVLSPLARLSVPNPLGGSGTVSGEVAEAIVSGLLRNVYHAFDYREESVIYDTLERSASGDLLTEIYLETKRALELRNQGGARARIQDLEIVALDPRPLPDVAGFESRCTWIVTGSVGHWGHIHQRRNQYEATLTIRPRDGEWKITGLELLSEERL